MKNSDICFILLVIGAMNIHPIVAGLLMFIIFFIGKYEHDHGR